MPTIEVGSTEADYAGLTIDAETGRQLGDTGYANEPTRMLYDAPPTTVIDGRDAPAESYSPDFVTAHVSDTTTAYAPAEPYDPDPSQGYVTPAGYQDPSAYPPQRQGNASTVIIAISATVGIAALLVIVLHLSGVAPWLRGSQANNATAEETTTTQGNSTDAEDDTGTQEPTPVQQPPAETGTSQSEPTQTPHYVMPDSSSRIYTAADLDGYSLWELYIARNEIYARHGRLFKNKDLQDYFNEQSWYHGTIAPDDFDDERILSDVERANAGTMLQYEKDHNSPYLN